MRENKLKKTLKTVAPIDERKLGTYLEKIEQHNPEKVLLRAKIQSISVYPDDVAVLRKLKHYIEEQTGAMNVPVSAIYRAAIHLISADEKFLDVYKKIK